MATNSLDKQIEILYKLNSIAHNLLIDKLRDIQLKDAVLDSRDQAVVLMCYRRINELVKGICVLLDDRLGMLSESLLRDLMESYTHFSFIVENKEQINQRALAYYYQDLQNGEKYMRNCLIEMKDYPNSIKQIKDKIKQLTKSKNSLELAVVHDLWENYKKKMRNGKNYKNDIKYYSLFLEEINSVNMFVKIYLPEGIDKNLYSNTSHQTHGLNATRDLDALKKERSLAHISYVKSDSPVLNAASLYVIHSIQKFMNYYDINDEKTNMELEGTIQTMNG